MSNISRWFTAGAILMMAGLPLLAQQQAPAAQTGRGGATAAATDEGIPVTDPRL
jgi:hypothetical protein